MILAKNNSHKNYTTENVKCKNSHTIRTHFNIKKFLIYCGAFLSFTLSRKMPPSRHSLCHPKINKKNIIFIILAFNRTNSLIALLYSGTCAVLVNSVYRTWLDLVSMEKLYTSSFFLLQ